MNGCGVEKDENKTLIRFRKLEFGVVMVAKL
jgi:hypothetical protein